jgi:hypothetical protein
VADTQRRTHAMLDLLGEPLVWAMFADGALLNPAPIRTSSFVPHGLSVCSRLALVSFM